MRKGSWPLTAPKGAPVDHASHDNITDIADVKNIVPQQSLDQLITQQKKKFLTNLPDILDKELTDAHPSKQNTIINGDVITFSTLNVCSIQNIVRSSQTLDLFRILDHDFVGLTETRHVSQLELKIQHKDDSDYVSFWNKSTSTFEGVGLLIKRTWSSHIFKTHCNHDRYIYIDLLFKGKLKLRVINVYLPSSNQQKELSIKIQNEIMHLLKESIEQHYHIIIMGDFNCDLDEYYNIIDRQKSVRFKYRLVHYLHSHDFLDSHKKCNDNPSHTWANANKSIKTRIDGVFIYRNLVDKFVYTGIRHPLIYSTDHLIVTTYFERFDKPLAQKKKRSK